MTKQNTSRNFDFKRGEKLEVLDRIVRVYNQNSGARIYSLNGKLLAEHSAEEIKRVQKEFDELLYITMSDCVLVKDGDIWKLFSYEGEKLCDKPIYKVDWREIESGFVILYYKAKNEEEQAAVFSTTGKCIIPFDMYEFDIHKNFIIVKYHNGKCKLYDVQLKEFLEGEFEEVKPFFGNIILKTSEGYFLYNMQTKSVDIKFDVYLDLNVCKFGMHFYEVHHLGKCGLYASYRHVQKSVRKRFSADVVLPIEFKRFRFEDNGIRAFRNGKIEYYSYDSIKNQVFSKDIEQSVENVCKEKGFEEEVTVKLFDKIDVKRGEVATWFGKFIAIRLKREREAFDYNVFYKYFALDGTYIGKSDDIYDENREIWIGQSFISTENWIALSDNTGVDSFSGRYYGNWTLYSYDGKEIFSVKFNQINQKFDYYIAESYTDKFIAIFTSTGKLLFTLNDYNKLSVINPDCFIAEGIDETLWFYNSKGKLIFTKGLKKKEIIKIGDSFWLKHADGYEIYDLITKKVYKVKVENVEIIYSVNAYYIKIYYEGRCGIYIYTNERDANSTIVGLKEIVSMQYEDVQLCDNKFFRAVKEESVAVYGVSGNLITTTER